MFNIDTPTDITFHEKISKSDNQITMAYTIMVLPSSIFAVDLLQFLGPVRFGDATICRSVGGGRGGVVGTIITYKLELFSSKVNFLSQQNWLRAKHPERYPLGLLSRGDDSQIELRFKSEPRLFAALPLSTGMGYISTVTLAIVAN